MGVYVCAWERRCCQPAFVCVSAHVSLFKHHMLVILCRRTYSAEQNLVTLLVHCHIYRASIRPQPLWPPPCHPFVFSSSVTSLVLQVYGWTAVKEGIPALEPTSLSGYRKSLYCRSVCNVSAHIQDVVWATYSVVTKVVTVFQWIIEISPQIFAFLCTPPLLHVGTLQSKLCSTL